ncbi:MAG TPA: molybdopterin dinucleotide binding domain-containing protein [Gemmatimonadaceae bacterium]|nr:molybdopterin dinucleotide binding domain-containing protein [Gemmatimonadaceae bacterium]
MVDSRDRVLRVERLVATRSGDEERGPAVWLNPSDAEARLLQEGELAWVHGPRRHELAVVHVDPEQRRGDVRLRDVLGASPSELIRVTKPDLDRQNRFAARVRRV